MQCSFKTASSKPCSTIQGSSLITSLSTCKNDIANHLRNCLLQREGLIKNEDDLLRFRGGYFEESSSSLTICPTHRYEFGVTWRKSVYCVLQFACGGKKKPRKARQDCSVNCKQSLYMWKEEQRLIPFGSDRKKYRKRSDKFINALIRLEEYATFRADRMPDSQTALLPYGTRRIRIYEQYHQENKKETQLKRSSFMLMWSKYLPHLKIKQTNSFSKCTTCTSIERQLEMEHDHVKRAKLMKLRAEHNDGHMAERKYYYSKRKRAVDSSSEYLSLIADGMDQDRVDVNKPGGTKLLFCQSEPIVQTNEDIAICINTAERFFDPREYYTDTCRAVTSADKVSSHITGVIAHGQNRFKTFLDLCQYPHDSNLTLNILLFVLEEISRMMGNKLPPIRYLQADNCWRENKNKYIISFCELLVHLQIFREVHLSFLVVGHTHEDIDAAFSKISEKLRTKDVETLPTLLKIIPDVSEIKFLYNIRDWLIPVISNFKQHTDPLHYRFKGETQTDVVNIYQKKTQDKPWVQLTFGAFLVPILPKGVPKLVQPSFERKINTKRLNSCISSWNCLFRNQIQQTSKIWWQNFVKYLEKMETSALFRIKEISETANWILPKLPKLNRYEEPNTSDQQIPNELIQMVQDERRQNEVIVIPKKFISKGKKKGHDKGL
ncbi:unnamed protein product [Mytilus coruscus]|uniref:DUF7869 domain-containing protein n=1 Tax=Mytilus coruscus TaxID=42192 RepID=A0A6J8B0W0_MYTCO|nr:unnamed protein product [Mytilus coruscus]